MFDTHCHLNFSRFKKNLDEVIVSAKTAGIVGIVIPGTDIESSKKAIEIAEKYDWIYAAVGIHPHHAYTPEVEERSGITSGVIRELEKLLSHPRVVAVGEVGMDRHEYKSTKYKTYKISKEFVDLQKQLFELQIDLAIKYKKSLILHNREAKKDVLPIVKKKWDRFLEGRTVFHCCEPDLELLQFAMSHKMYIGVDGDVTYWKEKQEFIKEVPIQMLVLETDSPFLLPEPLRTLKKFPNEPKNIPLIAKCIANLMQKDIEEIIKQTTENARKLFSLTYR